METISVVFGNRVRNLRNQKGMSQERLAELAGLHSTYIGQIERGEKNPTVDTVSKIAKGLGIPMVRFFENIDGLVDNEPTIPMKCYELVSSVNEAQQEQLLEMIQRIDEYGKSK